MVRYIKISFPHFILRWLQNIVKENIYGIKIELWTRRVVISLKFDDILVPLPNHVLKTDGTARIKPMKYHRRNANKQKTYCKCQLFPMQLLFVLHTIIMISVFSIYKVETIGSISKKLGLNFQTS